jgi:hypothetical protein
MLGDALARDHGVAIGHPVAEGDWRQLKVKSSQLLPGFGFAAPLSTDRIEHDGEGPLGQPSNVGAGFHSLDVGDRGTARDEDEIRCSGCIDG